MCDVKAKRNRFMLGGECYPSIEELWIPRYINNPVCTVCRKRFFMEDVRLMEYNRNGFDIVAKYRRDHYAIQWECTCRSCTKRDHTNRRNHLRGWLVRSDGEHLFSVRATGVEK